MAFQCNVEQRKACYPSGALSLQLGSWVGFLFHKMMHRALQSILTDLRVRSSANQYKAQTFGFASISSFNFFRSAGRVYVRAQMLNSSPNMRCARSILRAKRSFRPIAHVPGKWLTYALTWRACHQLEVPTFWYGLNSEYSSSLRCLDHRIFQNWDEVRFKPARRKAFLTQLYSCTLFEILKVTTRFVAISTGSSPTHCFHTRLDSCTALPIRRRSHR